MVHMTGGDVLCKCSVVWLARLGKYLPERKTIKKRMLADLIVVGCLIAVQVRPGARRNDILWENGLLRVWVTAAPEGGKANRAVHERLADSPGVAKSRWF